MKEALKLAEQSIKDLMHALAEGRVTGDDYQPEEIEAFSVLDSIKASLAQPEQEPCEMGQMCLGCSPRNADGSCPDAKPNGACSCYQDGFRDGAKEFEELHMAQPEQEPVAQLECAYGYSQCKALEISQKKRPWVGLTAQEAADCWTTSATQTWHKFEAALRSKNT